MATTEQKIINFVEDNFMMMRDPDTLDLNTSLMDQGLIDSTGVLELVAWIEKEFNFTIEDEEITIPNLGSIKKMVVYVDKKQAEVSGVNL